MEGLLVLVSTEEAFNLNYCESSAGTLGIACLCVGTGATSARTGWGGGGGGGLGSTKPVGLRNLCLIVRHLVWKEWICMETGLLYRQSPGCPVQPPGCTCLQSGWSPLHNDQNWDWDTSLMSMTLSMSVSMVGTRPACTPSVVRVWIVPAAARAICMGWEMMRSTCRVLDRMVAEMVMSPISH